MFVKCLVTTKFPLLLVYLLLGCCVLKANESLAQNDGLRFRSYEVVQDKRTGMALFPAGMRVGEQDVCEVTMELAFLQGHPYYFGYILRVLVNEQLNIDLTFDGSLFSSGHFRATIGDSATGMAFNIDSIRLLTQWNKIRLVLNGQTGEVLLYNNQVLAGRQKLPAVKMNSLRLFYGAHHYQSFANTDVPPMKLRNLQVVRNGKVTAYYPLNEHKGITVHDTVENNNGRVDNPDWLSQQHYTWQKTTAFNISGAASAVYDADGDKLYIFGRDSAYIYTVGTATVAGVSYASGRQLLVPGSKSIYAAAIKKLINLYPDQHLAATFDAAQRRWDRQYRADSQITVWHFNPFFAAADTSIYMLGGYGHYSYHNTLLRYAVNNKRWDTITTTGERFTPRYLFGGAGNAAGDTAYFIGGYGSSSGKQIEHPHNLYDLVRFTTRDKKFETLYTLAKPAEDFAFASSLVLDPASQSFYALVYPNHTFDSRLRLLKGSLTSPAYELLADEMPYHFQDITSFADLYYSPQSNKLLALTLYIDSSQNTQVQVFDIASPPGVDTYADMDEAHHHWQFWLIAGAIIVAGLGVLCYRKVQRRMPVTDTGNRPYTAPSPEPTPGKAHLPTPLAEAQPEIPDAVENIALYKGSRNALFLFGEFQLFDREGVDIIRSFSPVLRELFLVIYLHTVQSGRGISTDKLMETLWPGKPLSSARNNRSVNVTKLKNLLEGVEYLQLVKNDDYLSLVADPEHFYVDYAHYRTLVSERRQPGRHQILALSAIVSRGGLLSGVEKEWLDPFKAEVSNTIIDLYMQFASQASVQEDAALLVRLADEVFYFDSLHEQALLLKCQCLVSLGKHALARKTYEQYCREYKRVYDAEYDKTLPDILGEKEG